MTASTAPVPTTGRSKSDLPICDPLTQYEVEQILAKLGELIPVLYRARCVQ
jgi:hypothetical protein